MNTLLDYPASFFFTIQLGHEPFPPVANQGVFACFIGGRRSYPNIVFYCKASQYFLQWFRLFNTRRVPQRDGLLIFSETHSRTWWLLWDVPRSSMELGTNCVLVMCSEGSVRGEFTYLRRLVLLCNIWIFQCYNCLSYTFWMLGTCPIQTDWQAKRLCSSSSAHACQGNWEDLRLCQFCNTLDFF